MRAGLAKDGLQLAAKRAERGSVQARDLGEVSPAEEFPGEARLGARRIVGLPQQGIGGNIAPPAPTAWLYWSKTVRYKSGSVSAS
ncbi:hypothetical protein [Methylobacterium nigriterrae]|uniref:hypothetical protein n=1 Tax=Methylobacterium nigriterrae TaxID=3127512 RepID=UPI003013E48B